MKTYDTFKSQGGYAVALGVYNDCPVIGSCRWFENEAGAKDYAKNIQQYKNDYAASEEQLNSCCSLDEVDRIVFPHKENYDLEKGIPF